MPHAQLTLTIPDSVWISEISRGNPNTRFRVLAATANMSAGVARIEIIGDNPERICEEFREHDSVTELTVFETAPEECQVQVETTEPLLLTSLQDAGVPIEMPFEVSDGEMALEVTVPQRTLTNLGSALDNFGIQYTVDRIQEEVETDTSLLTERQQWALDEALDRGYYDTPRGSTLVELAEELDIAKSTCSQLLHRAEERVLKESRGVDRGLPTGITIISD